jgi:hypothetical protein
VFRRQLDAIFEKVVEVHRTATGKSSADCTWECFNVTLRAFFGDDFEIPVQVEVYDEKKMGSDSLIGTASFTLSEVSSGLRNPEWPLVPNPRKPKSTFSIRKKPAKPANPNAPVGVLVMVSNPIMLSADGPSSDRAAMALPAVSATSFTLFLWDGGGGGVIALHCTPPLYGVLSLLPAVLSTVASDTNGPVAHPPPLLIPLCFCPTSGWDPRDELGTS